MYKKLPKRDPVTGDVIGIADCILRVSDKACIPFAPDNSDYQVFLRWCEEGNEPLPPDEEK